MGRFARAGFSDDVAVVHEKESALVRTGRRGRAFARAVGAPVGGRPLAVRTKELSFVSIA
jgi:hypothetical protein